MTFYSSTAQLPDYYDYNMENRTYKFFGGEPLYPFGYGLSYTSFAYDNLQFTPTITAGEEVAVSVDVRNTGEVAGDEVVQLYVKDVEATVRVPRHSLQAFERVRLEPGETRTVTFSLTPEQLAVLSDNMAWVVEPGEFVISIGGGQPGFADGIATGILQVAGGPLVVRQF